MQREDRPAPRQTVISMDVDLVLAWLCGLTAMLVVVIDLA